MSQGTITNQKGEQWVTRNNNESKRIIVSHRTIATHHLTPEPTNDLEPHFYAPHVQPPRQCLINWSDWRRWYWIRWSWRIRIVRIIRILRWAEATFQYFDLHAWSILVWFGEVVDWHIYLSQVGIKVMRISAPPAHAVCTEWMPHMCRWGNTDVWWRLHW